MCGLGVAGLVEGGEEGEDAGGCLGGDGGIGGDSVGHLFFFFFWLFFPLRLVSTCLGNWCLYIDAVNQGGLVNCGGFYVFGLTLFALG